jgi:hypothetical protein
MWEGPDDGLDLSRLIKHAETLLRTKDCCTHSLDHQMLCTVCARNQTHGPVFRRFLAATNSPLPDVEDSWSLHDHCIEFVFQAALGNVLQTPVPIVVVVRAEELGTVTDILPGAAVECHPHVVLTADPWCHFRLNKTSSNL